MIDKKERTKLKNEIISEFVDKVIEFFRPIINKQNKEINETKGYISRLEKKYDGIKYYKIYPNKEGKYICPVCGHEVK